MTNKEVQRRKKIEQLIYLPRIFDFPIDCGKKPQNSIEYFVSYDMYKF